MRHYVGVDIGLKGAMSLLSEEKKVLACEPIPTIDVLVGKKMRSQYDIQKIYEIIRAWTDDFHIEKAGMERLRAIPNQASMVAFSMGGGLQMFKTIFTILKIPFVEIEPHSWQKSVFGELGIQYTRETTKKASVQACRQLFPMFSFKRTPRCTTDDDGMTDSANISYYIAK
jgi:hypothetical protein